MPRWKRPVAENSNFSLSDRASPAELFSVSLLLSASGLLNQGGKFGMVMLTGIVERSQTGFALLHYDTRLVDIGPMLQKQPGGLDFPGYPPDQAVLARDRPL